MIEQEATVIAVADGSALVDVQRQKRLFRLQRR